MSATIKSSNISCEMRKSGQMLPGKFVGENIDFLVFRQFIIVVA